MTGSHERQISPGTEAHLRELLDNQNTYRPSPEYAQQLGDREALLFVAPAAGGKSFIMETVARLSDRHVIAGNNTSRGPRPDDKGRRYGYIDYSDQGFAPVFAEIARGEVVQYGVFPGALDLYFTRASDFYGEINMMDALAGSIDGIQSIPFRHVSAVSLVTEAGSWLHRFNQRFPVGHEKRGSRIAQAVESLTWSLDQSETDMFWVENITNEPEITAQHIVGLSDGRYMYEPRLRRVAEQCLKAVQRLEA